MPNKIGILLPRSTDYPTIGFDMLDGLRCGLQYREADDISVITDNIGFGEDVSANYAKAEKMLLQEDAQLLIVYSNPSNAEALYPLAQASGCPFLFLDAGMQLPNERIPANCYHISLQALHGCYMTGYMAGSGQRKILMATSFYDGGYSGPLGYHSSVFDAGGSICGNYVSGYKVADFSIAPYLDLLQTSGAEGVAACFSTYLAELFMQALKTAGSPAVSVPFYCSPYMAEEQLLAKCNFPGGVFHAVVPWSSQLTNPSQEDFIEIIRSKKNKPATIFHLLGWEAGIVTATVLQESISSLEGVSYESPRGTVTFHNHTHHTYAPLYYGTIEAGENNKCVFKLVKDIPVTADMHAQYLVKPGGVSSGWKNNYFCI